jgi:hypothetical protein
MADPRKPTALERLSGNLATQSALTVIGAVAGGPLAPLLPILATSLAATRQQRRIEAELDAIQRLLAERTQAIENLSDEQYKLVNEAVLAVLQTTHATKLKLLRNAVQNSLTLEGVQSREAVMLSRIIRDISAEEADFLLRTFQYAGIQILTTDADSVTADGILNISPASSDALNVSGLLSLGLLTPAESSFDSMGVMRFSGLSAKVIALLREP